MGRVPAIVPFVLVGAYGRPPSTSAPSRMDGTAPNGAVFYFLGRAEEETEPLVKVVWLLFCGLEWGLVFGFGIFGIVWEDDQGLAFEHFAGDAAGGEL